MNDAEWDQANDPWMVNKTLASVIGEMSGPICDAEHVDGWGARHWCERAGGHTGRHFASEPGGRYIVAVWR